QGAGWPQPAIAITTQQRERAQLRRLTIEPRREPILRRRRAERAHRVADGSIAGATTQVAGHRLGIPGRAITPIELGEHADHKAGCAVTTLRSALLDHRRLHGVQRVGARANALDADNLATRDRADQREAAVDRHVVRIARAPPADQRDRTGPALSFGAAFLAADQ